MRHKVDGRLFGRTANQRKALLRGIVTSLFEHQRIETTVAKAKEAKRIAERMITFGIKGDLHSKRQVFSYLPDRTVASRLFNEIAPRFTGRNGGYLRIVQSRNRLKDSAPMAILEFIDYETIKKPRGKRKKETKEGKTEEAERPEKKVKAEPKKKPEKKEKAEKEEAKKPAKKEAKKSAESEKSGKKKTEKPAKTESQEKKQ